MATKGLVRWDDPNAYYVQTNNVVESIIRKTQERGGSGFLESCGPASGICILDAIGANIKTMTPGGWEPQPEDLLTSWFNDERNYPALKKHKPELDPYSYFGNEIAQYYELAIPAVFGVPTKFVWGVSIDAITAAIDGNKGVLLCLQKPGHFIAAVAYDKEAKKIIYHDPWPNNPWPMALRGTPGRARAIAYNDLMMNLKQFRVEIG